MTFLHRGPYVAMSLLALLFLASFGCNSKGITRHQVSGTVTYKGKPVEYGMITFEPEASVGMIAPTCYAAVADGVFETKREESPTHGAYTVRVAAYDTEKMKPGLKADPLSMALLIPLFPEYVARVEIPPPDGRLDIIVPEEPSRSAVR